MNLIKLYETMSHWPFGKKLFSIIASQKAPYFSTIKPFISELTESSCVVLLKKRKGVLNHLGTIHAIAMCNACEFAFGLTMEAGLPRSLRWIPRGMTVRYLKKADTNLTATCSFSAIKALEPGDHVVKVEVRNTRDEIVMDADITVYIIERKAA